MSNLVLMATHGNRIILTHPDGTQIVVRLSEIRSGGVRLRFEAPKSIDIRREKVEFPFHSEPDVNPTNRLMDMRRQNQRKNQDRQESKQVQGQQQKEKEQEQVAT